MILTIYIDQVSVTLTPMLNLLGKTLYLHKKLSPIITVTKRNNYLTIVVVNEDKEESNHLQLLQKVNCILVFKV